MQRLYEKMEERIREIQSASFPLLKETSQCINVCQEALQELRKMVEKNPLKDSKEEIEFFKEMKPKFYSQFIYYVKVFHIEINRPAASDKVQIAYLESHLNRIKHFFDNNLDFYKYYRSGATHFDEVYFIRGQEDVRLLPDDLTLSIDHSFSTTQSYKVSKLFAYELLRIYLNTAISSIQLTDPPEPKNIEKKLQWTVRPRSNGRGTRPGDNETRCQTHMVAARPGDACGLVQSSIVAGHVGGRAYDNLGDFKRARLSIFRRLRRGWPDLPFCRNAISAAPRRSAG